MVDRNHSVRQMADQRLGQGSLPLHKLVQQGVFQRDRHVLRKCKHVTQICLMERASGAMAPQEEPAKEFMPPEQRNQRLRRMGVEHRFQHHPLIQAGHGGQRCPAHNMGVELQPEYEIMGLAVHKLRHMRRVRIVPDPAPQSKCRITWTLQKYQQTPHTDRIGNNPGKILDQCLYVPELTPGMAEPLQCGSKPRLVPDSID